MEMFGNKFHRSECTVYLPCCDKSHARLALLPRYGLTSDEFEQRGHTVTETESRSEWLSFFPDVECMTGLRSRRRLLPSWLSLAKAATFNATLLTKTKLMSSITAKDWKLLESETALPRLLALPVEIFEYEYLL